MTPVTYIDIAHPANVNGIVNRATVQWSAGPCDGAFKVVVLRPTGLPSTFNVVAQRGPFSAVVGRNDVALSPAVTIAQGDVIGVVQLLPRSTCGSVLQQVYAPGTSSVLITTGDVGASGGIGTSSNFTNQFALAAVAYAADPLLVRIVPAAGAVQGSGAFFRTSLQLYNGTKNAITGKMFFHKAGTSGGDGDPALAFSIAPGQTASYADVVTAMGSSGLGSLDVRTDGGVSPIVSARVFSDGGSNGTSGFTEPGLDPQTAITFFRGGAVLFLPADLTNFRMNVGVRTLETGATLDITLFDANGNLVATRTGVVYAANYFEQPTAAQFTGVTALPAGGSIVVKVNPGAAFVYGTITDNRTQDSSMRIAAND